MTDNPHLDITALAHLIADILLKNMTSSFESIVQQLKEKFSLTKEFIENNITELFEIFKLVKAILEDPKISKKRGPKYFIQKLGLSMNHKKISIIIYYLVLNFNQIQGFYSNEELKWLQDNGVDLNKVIRIKTRWYWVDKDKIFQSLSSSEKKNGLDLAKEFLVTFVLPATRTLFDLSPEVSPSAAQLRKTKYHRLLNKLMTENKITLNQLLKFSGLLKRRENIYDQLNLQELEEFFVKKILPFYREKGLPLNMAPLEPDIHNDFRGFLNALSKINILYTLFVRDLGLEPQIEKRFESGKLAHKIINFILTRATNSLKLFKYYSEIKIYYPQNNRQIDGLIKLDNDVKQYLFDVIRKNLKNNSEQNRLISYLEYSDYLLFDYTTIFSRLDGIKLYKTRIYNKIKKYTPNSVFSLFIISTDWPNEYKYNIYALPSKITFNLRKRFYSIDTFHVEILSPVFFSKLMGLTNQYLKDFNLTLNCNRFSDFECLFFLYDKYKKTKLNNMNNFINEISRTPYLIFSKRDKLNLKNDFKRLSDF